jgi:alkylation response protein AidB-like acyl-CoA dehydrogenase
VRFALDAEQRDFAASLLALLDDADVPSVARAWADGDVAPGRALWKRLAELGVTALAVPERAGGLGAHPVDLVVALEVLGRRAVPGPVVESLAAVPALLAGLGHDQWLAGLAGGELIATLVAPPHVPYALDADAADLVLTAGPDGVGVVPALAPEPERSLDPTRRLFRPASTPTSTTASSGARHDDTGVDVDAPPAVGRAFEFGVLGCAAQLVGLGAGLLDAAVAHARAREQFGRPVGSFQAVAHQLADVHVGLELARPLLHGAAVALATGAGTAARDVSAAKVAAARAAHRAATTGLQVHGAVGYTREHDLGRWLTKARALVTAWGTPAVHRARVREALA